MDDILEWRHWGRAIGTSMMQVEEKVRATSRDPPCGKEEVSPAERPRRVFLLQHRTPADGLRITEGRETRPTRPPDYAAGRTGKSIIT